MPPPLTRLVCAAGRNMNLGLLVVPVQPVCIGSSVYYSICKHALSGSIDPWRLRSSCCAPLRS
eukprot:1660529-Pyramimonas_sp.AAC.1